MGKKKKKNSKREKIRDILERGLFWATNGYTEPSGQADQIRNEIETGPQPWVTGLRANLCGGVVEDTESEPLGTEWQGVMGLSESEGELTYTRNSEDGRCSFAAELTGVASIGDCGAGCTFARQMTIGNLSIDDEANSTCSAEELLINGETVQFAQSDVFLGEFEETLFYALWEDEGGSWETVSDGYSIVFGDLTNGAWYFGVSDD